MAIGKETKVMRPISDKQPLRHARESDTSISQINTSNNYKDVLNSVINHPLIPSLHISYAAFLSCQHQAKEDPGGCNGRLHRGKTLHRGSRPDPNLRR
jgi:hypothetical protein